MIRRDLLAAVCLVAGGLLAFVRAFAVFNFAQLAREQTFAESFVHHAVDEGSAMTTPEIAPITGTTPSHDDLTKMLDRAHQIGPVLTIEATTCTVQSDPDNVCGGQLLACVVEGQGQQGLFVAHIAMCRSGNLAANRLARSEWTLQFTNGEPVEQQERSYI